MDDILSNHGYNEEANEGDTENFEQALNKLTKSKIESRFRGRQLLKSTIEAGMGKLQSAAGRSGSAPVGPSSEEIDSILTVCAMIWKMAHPIVCIGYYGYHSFSGYHIHIMVVVI